MIEPLATGAHGPLIRRPILLGGIAVVAVIGVIVAAVVWPRGETSLNAVDTILTGADREEIAQAAGEIARSADPSAIQKLADAATSRPEIAATLESIRDRMIGRLAGGSEEVRIRILEALAIIDDPASASALVDSLVLDAAPEVRAAAAAALPNLDQSLGVAIDALIIERGEATGPTVDEIDDVFRAIGDPAIQAVASVDGRPQWALNFLVSLGEPAVGSLRELIATGNLYDLGTVAGALVKLEGTHPEVAASLWPEVLGGLRDQISPRPQRDSQIADILSNIARVQPSLARPVQTEIVDALLPKLGGSFAVSDALAHVGSPAVPKLIAIARQGGTFVSQDIATRADHARLALTTMIMVNRKALAPLVEALKHRDYEFIADLMLFYLEFGKPGSEPVLIEALNRHGDTVTALQFLQSGNSKLEDGAYSWAAANGYEVTGSFSGPGTWGAGRPPKF